MKALVRTLSKDERVTQHAVFNTVAPVVTLLVFVLVVFRAFQPSSTMHRMIVSPVVYFRDLVYHIIIFSLEFAAEIGRAHV